jgi:GAF domain-containing protein
VADTFLDLLYGEAPRAAYDRLLADAEAAATTDTEVAALREQYDVALRIRELLARRQAREAELRALYETASDLTAIRDVDAILSAIARRARQLLNADMTYLSLNDEADGASYMKVTEGALTPEFRRLRLPLGTGLLGLVAQSGAPYFTEDYQADARFVHRDFIDDAVAGEKIRAILGVPLMLDGRVIGALLAVHRTVRPFPPSEVSLLTSFAAHAAVALENAQLFADLDAAHRTMTEHTEAVENAAVAHDRLTDLLVAGGGVEEVAAVLAEVLGGDLAIHDPDGSLLAGTPVDADWAPAVAEALASGRSVRAGEAYVATAQTGPEHVATLVLRSPAELPQPQRRTLERGALVTALVILFARTVAETEDRLGGELLGDLLDARTEALPALRERARRRQVSLDGPLVLAVAEVTGLPRFAAGRAVARLAGEHRGLAGEHRGRPVLLVPGDDPVAVGDALAAAVSSAGGSATVGVSATTVETLAAGHDEARRCLDTLLTLGRHGEVSDPAGLGLARLLLGENGPEQLAAYVSTTLGPVLTYDAERGTALEETLDAWFATGGRVKETAARLHVHPNTVSQRLDRVGELLGSSWRDPGRALDLQLALRVHRLRGGS